MDKLEQTWDRYCAALEEMRRLQDEARKRRKVSAGVEVIAKGGGVISHVPTTGETANPLAVDVVVEDNVLR